MQVNNRELNTNLDKLPRPIEAPITALHDMIQVVSSKLREVLTTGDDYSGQMYDLQIKLEQDIHATLPAFVPFRETDEGRSETYEPFAIDGWLKRSLAHEHEEVVYMDGLMELIKRYV